LNIIDGTSLKIKIGGEQVPHMAEFRHKFDLTEVIDVAFQVYSSQISEDYLAIIRKYVLPGLDTPKVFGIRELRTINCVYRHENDMTASLIATVLRYDPATITRAVNRLKQDGLVRTLENKYDARSAIIKTTEAGDKLTEQYKRRHHAVLNQLSQMQDIHLSEHEVEMFLKISQKIAKRAARMHEMRPQDFKNRLKSIRPDNFYYPMLRDKLA